ncbi:hypothetical protein [Bacillus sp. WP8]
MREGVIAYKIGGDGGDVGKGHGGGEKGDDGLWKGRFEFRWGEELKL